MPAPVLCRGAIWQIGVDLERMFGFWRIGPLYLLSGVFGTIASAMLKGIIES